MKRWLRRLARLDRDYLGINRRNLELVQPLNPRSLRPLVDDKLTCKRKLQDHGVAVPQTLAVFSGFRDLAGLDGQLTRWDRGFVAKPAQSSGGQGILVVTRGREGDWLQPTRRGPRRVDTDTIREHLAQILSGMYTSGKSRDRAFVEELVRPEAGLADLGGGGLPDVRVILHKRRPVQAMLRVATARSGGRANLHQGAIGIGVDLETGETVRAICEGRPVERHPDSGGRLIGRNVPLWDAVVDAALRSAEAFELAYLGVDIVLDAERGPLVLEVNARPGLAIQLANGRGLREMLRKLEVDG
jgi:alpha-L-glutamate ligase-like protein